LKDDVSALSILFMRRSVGKLMFISSVRRSLSFLFLIFLTNSSAWHPAMAQTLKNLEGAVNVFGQFSGTSNGNGIQDRYTERYATPLFPVHVQDNMHEVSGAYLVQGPTIPILGLQPFGAVGVGALIFLPTTVGGQRYNQQTRIPLLYEFGVNYPILTSHLGLRLQYRGLSYKTPDFNSSLLTTNARRQTSEPSVGAYFRF
jgi:hypothetical protein